MAGAANLQDPEALRRFAQALRRFHTAASAVLSTAPHTLDRTRDRLATEFAPAWRKEQQRRQEAFGEARRKWQEAEAEVKLAGRRGQIDRASSMDEQREMRKAQRRLEEAEAKLAEIKTWLARLDSDGKDLATKVRDHHLAIDDLAAKALLRLDQMAASIDDYLRAGGGSP
jgi:hypothetical protein